MSLRFPAVKLLDFARRRAELAQHESPFAVVVMAHLEARRTRTHGRRRLRGKLDLVRELHRRGYGETDVRQLFRFIDWLLTLPDELQGEFQTELRSLEEEKNMPPYITSVERWGRDRGREEGHEKGLAEGLAEGHEKGRKEGLAAGHEEGRREGLLEGVRLGLELRFGDEGLALMAEVQGVEDEALLRRIQEALIRGSSLEEVQQIWRR